MIDKLSGLVVVGLEWIGGDALATHSLAFSISIFALSLIVLSRTLSLKRWLSAVGLTTIFVAFLVAETSRWFLQKPSPEVRSPTTQQSQVQNVTQIIPGLYWNTWFTGDNSPPGNELLVAKDYTVNLDLSAFDYHALRSNIAEFAMSVSADKPVGTIVSSDAKFAWLTIKPIITEGSGLSIVGPQPPPMHLDLDKIRSPDLMAAYAYTSASASLPVPEELRSGVSSFVIRTREKGCARITFAIFEDLKPLDHLVQRVVVRDRDGSLPECAKLLDAKARKLSGGLDALRDASLGTETSGKRVIGDAALYIFDADENSVAVFIDGRKGVKKSVYGWQTDRSVVGYLRNGNFEQRVAQARTDAAKNHAGAYVLAAKDLWTELFTGNDGTEGEAKDAAIALKELVKTASVPPVIVVRIASSAVTGKTRSLFAPLGILGAKGQGAVLDKPIIVVQPMAIERFVSRDRCVGDWTLALPDQIDGDVDLSNIPAPLPGTRLQNMTQFSAFMSGDDAKEGSPQASGLLVLAHQGGGELWFKQTEKHVSRVGRSFSRGSTGILSACTVAATTSRNAQLLENLNQQGLDTVIASPFALDATYGVRFAYSFAEAIQEATVKAEQPTMLELFNRSVSKAIEKFMKARTGNYEELGLEYVLLGNPAIRLCAPPTVGQPR